MRKKPKKAQTRDADIAEVDNASMIALLKQTSDWLFVLENDGTLHSVIYAADPESLPCNDWIGQPFIEFVTVESVTKLKSLFSHQDSEPSAWRQVNYQQSNAGDLPVRYSASRLSGGRLLLIGQSMLHYSRVQQRMMRAQQALESDFAQMAHAKARYQLLFDLSAEALINIDVHSKKIIDANPAAQRLLGTYITPLKNNAFPTGFDPDSTDALNTLLKQAQLHGRADDVAVCTIDKRCAFLASAALVRDKLETVLMLRMSPLGDAAHETMELQSVAVFSAMVHKSPDAVLICNPDGTVITANDAFCHLTQLPSPSKAVGQNIENWLGSSSMDFRLLSTTLKEQSAVPKFLSVIRSELGTETEVEISAASVADSRFPYLLLIIRNVQSRSAVADELVVPTAGAPLKELVGRVPLKELVRESTDLVERLCIESALEMTSDNRASAAELLGLSRQSLYIKLRRFGIQDQNLGQD